MLWDALFYPFRREGWVKILAGALVAPLLFLTFTGSTVLAISAGGLGVGYFWAFFFECARGLMTGHNDPPDWPGLSDYYTDIVDPAIRGINILAASLGPFILTLLLFPGAGARGLEWIVVGAVYFVLSFPITTVSVIYHDNILAASPHVTLPAVLRTFFDYVVVTAACAVAGVMVLAGWTLEVVSPLLGWYVSGVLFIYALMFTGRLLGLYYLKNRAVLGWDERE